MADASLLKEVTIKTGIVKRLVKELACYKKEAEKEASRLETMKTNPDTDEYLIKKQAEVLQDTRQMIPNCSQRIAKALEDLKKVVESNSGILEGTPQLIAASEQIKAAEILF